MSISYSGQYYDQVLSDYVSIVKQVGTTPIKACVNDSNLPGRQELLVYNDSNKVIYVGTPAVTFDGLTKGIPIEPNELFNPPAGDGIDFYLVVESGTANAIIQELS